MTPHPLDNEFTYLKISIAAPKVVLVQLNRPRKRNAINSDFWKEIGHVFERLGRGGDCRCIILSGVGKAFSAGIDVKDSIFFSFGDSENGDVARRGLAFLPQIFDMQRCFTAAEDCPVPVIAAIHGSCIGAGIDLACCCDIRLCAPGSVFSVREVKIGLAADIGTLQRLPKITGNDSRVRELCYTGETFDHKDALGIGFVSRVTEDPTADAIELGTAIASNSPVAVMGTKQAIVYSRDHSVHEGLDYVARHNALALMTDDIPNAFMSSRDEKPKFDDLLPSSRL